MTDSSHTSNQSNFGLRRRAEKMATQKILEEPEVLESLSPERVQEIVHELLVHQAELEMQNDELRLLQEELEVSRSRYFELYNLAPVGYCTLCESGLIQQANLTAANMLGVLPDDLINKPVTSFIVKEDQDIYYLFRKQLSQDRELKYCDLRMVMPDAGQLWVCLEASIVQTESGTTELRLALVDITDRKKHEAELIHAATHDMLTNLPNRRLLTESLEQALIRAQLRKKSLAICYLDLDGFKPINDQHGHSTGDQVLLIIAKKLEGILRAEDTMARLGGDEFVLIFNELASSEDVQPIIDRVLATVRSKIQVGKLFLELSASIGVTFYPQNEDVDADKLLRQADNAMYQAKQTGKNRYHFFDVEQDRNARLNNKGMESVRQALNHKEFVLHYQPKVDMVSGEIVGVEALVRWQRHERGLLSPAEFLHYIDGSDIETAFGEWVINSVLNQIAAWNAVGLKLSISANISAGHLLSADFVERLREALGQHPTVVPANLELEILETAALSDINQAVNKLTLCRKLGMKISLDDFGTSYSSLTYLRKLPVDILKIDQSFVRDMLTDSSDFDIVASVIRLAQTFKLAVIAEGVETLEQGAMLVQLGCRFMQGYGIARPMQADEIPGWVKQWKDKAVWLNLK